MCSFECWKNSFSYESLPAGGLSFSLVLYFPIIPLPLSCSRPLLFFSFTFVHHRYCSFSSSCSISTVFLSALPLVFLFLPSSFLDFCLSFYFFFHKVQRYKDPCSLLIIESMCFQSRCNRCVKTTTQPSAFTNIYEKMHHSKDLTDSNMLDAASAASQFIKFFPPRYSAINWKWRYHKVKAFRNHIVSQSHRAPNLLWH